MQRQINKAEKIYKHPNIFTTNDYGTLTYRFIYTHPNPCPHKYVCVQAQLQKHMQTNRLMSSTSTHTSSRDLKN